MSANILKKTSSPRKGSSNKRSELRCKDPKETTKNLQAIIIDRKTSFPEQQEGSNVKNWGEDKKVQ